MPSSDKVKQSLIPYYDPNFDGSALTDEEAALVLLQMRTGIVLLPPSRQSGHGSGSWSQKPVPDGNISGTPTDLKGSALTDEKLALVIRQLRMGIVHEHDPESRSQNPMHNSNSSGTAHVLDFTGPALTDEEAARILLQIRTGINPLPASSHPRRECGSQTRKPMHDNSGDRISETTPHGNREPKNATPQSIEYGSDVKIPATNPATSNSLDLDGKISHAESGREFYGAGEIIFAERVGHHSDATISEPELNKYEFAREKTSNIVVDNDSEATISDPELDNKYQFVWEAGSEISGNESDATISDPELDNKYQFVREAGSDISGNESDATISDPELEDKYQFVREAGSDISGNESDATISDPELEDKYQFVRETIVINNPDATIFGPDPELDRKNKYIHHKSGPLMVTDHHDLDEPISIPKSKGKVQ